MSGDLGGIANAIRGGQWRDWMKRAGGRWAKLEEKLGWVSSDALNAFIYFLAFLLSSGDLYLAVAAAALMWIGASTGWGDYIGALGGWRSDNLKENKYIDKLIRPLIYRPRWWGFAGLTIRGAWWALLLSVPLFYAGEIGNAFNFIVHGAMMGAAYWAAFAWLAYRFPNLPEEDRQQGGWGLGEIFFGVVLWSPLRGI